jgi:rRNA maturation RNase YbeY
LEKNRDFLAHDYYTDIITFDYSDGEIISGDLLISIDRVGENSQLMKVSFEEELHRVIIHGVLHLIGFKDKTNSDKQKMTSAENDALKTLNHLIYS